MAQAISSGVYLRRESRIMFITGSLAHERARGYHGPRTYQVIARTVSPQAERLTDRPARPDRRGVVRSGRERVVGRLPHAQRSPVVNAPPGSRGPAIARATCVRVIYRDVAKAMAW